MERREVTVWPFVGREKETRYLRAELDAGRSVVLTGPWGIGRTALARHVAGEMAQECLFAFVDFGRGPAEVWRALFAALFPEARARSPKGRRSAQWLRYRVSTWQPEDPRRRVLVLDDIARITARGLDTFRRLRERHQVLAIVEAFVPDPEIEALCTALRARRPLQLGHLDSRATRAFFEEYSRRHGFVWGPGEVRGLARAVAGFPLGMREAAAAEVRRRAGGVGGPRRETQG
jgi:replication-associated recombination protein RarA